jgi:hypothetical protein
MVAQRLLQEFKILPEMAGLLVPQAYAFESFKILTTGQVNVPVEVLEKLHPI